MEPGAERHDLPAPYRNPWLLLARNMRAVVASLRLSLWELWRRNGEGDVWLPGFWPRRFSAWFWPPVLVLLLGLLLTPVVVAYRQPTAAPAPSPAAAPNPVRSADPDQDQASASASTSAATSTQAQSPAPEPALVPAAPEPTPLRIDPLLELLAEQDPNGLIGSARPQPALSLLELTLADGFSSLAAPLRRQQAASWLERTQALGYERLELLDRQGRPLGRSALVGGGMIVLEPPETG